MQGYLIKSGNQLSLEENLKYFYSQCGLCESLKTKYGSASRFLVNRDTLFLQMVTESQQLHPPQSIQIRCGVKPQKHTAIADPIASNYAASITLLILYAKMKDNIEDSKLYKRSVSKFLLHIFKNKIRNAELHLNEMGFNYKKIFLYQKEQSLLEKSCDYIDLENISEPTSKGLGEVFFHITSITNNHLHGENLRKCGEILGKIFYILDALEDLEDDIRSGSYNPLVQKSSPKSKEAMKDEAKKFLCKNYEELLVVLGKINFANHELTIKNIIFNGLRGKISTSVGIKHFSMNFTVDKHIGAIDCCGIPVCPDCSDTEGCVNEDMLLCCCFPLRGR